MLEVKCNKTSKENQRIGVCVKYLALHEEF